MQAISGREFVPAAAGAAARPLGAAAYRRRTPLRMFRKLPASERALLVAHLLRLSAHDRAMRFMSTVSAWHIEQYGRPGDLERRVVLGYFVDDVLRGAGELVFATDPAWRGGCEMALSVETRWQNQGVGSELLRRLLLVARNRGSAPLRILFLRENRRIANLVRRFGMQLRYEGAEVEATISPGWPSHISLFAEGLYDSHATWASLAMPLVANPPSLTSSRSGDPGRRVG